MKEFTRVVKFTLFSISAGLIEIGAFTLLNELLHLPYWLSYLAALAASVLWNFTLNRKFTFQSANNVPRAMLKVALFYAVFTPLSTLLEHVLTEKLGWNEYLATGINMAAMWSSATASTPTSARRSRRRERNKDRASIEIPCPHPEIGLFFRREEWIEMQARYFCALNCTAPACR